MTLPIGSIADSGLPGVEGIIMDDQGPIAFATISVKGHAGGTVSDEKGYFKLEIPESGHCEIQVSHLGYISQSLMVTPMKNQGQPYTIIMKPYLNELNEMVVTGTRTEKNLEESVIKVAALDGKLLDRTNSVNLAEGLNYVSGLRVEVDCQTCNYTQLRINGLGGAYSQVLINNRPVFSSLAGLYGLEQFAANMIEKVEIVKGGGSALYGSNAIGGTVNIITKTPQSNAFSMSMETGLIAGSSWDMNLNGNYSHMFENGSATMFLNGRTRDAYDHNQDGFSELPQIKNLTGGINAIFRPSSLHEIKMNFLKINEYRRGGNKLDRPAHETDQAEERYHDIYSAGLDFLVKLPDLNSNLNIYAAGQLIHRDHYTGIDGVDAYGTTENYNINSGIQWNYYLDHHTFSAGFDYQFEDVLDVIPYYSYNIDQTTHLKGFFLQADLGITSSLMLLTGLRGDAHNMVDNMIFSPRVSLLYEPWPGIRLRGSFGTGFRAPQAFDADMHIAFSGGGIATVQLDPGLSEERSASYNASISFDKPGNDYIYGFTVEGFHTVLSDPFILEEDISTDHQTLLVKRNGSNAEVRGITLETRLNYRYIIEMEGGFTWQRSLFDQEVNWSMDVPGVKNFLRTPDTYGFYTLQWNPKEKTHLNFSGILTGPMLVPHYGGAPGIPEDTMERSGTFLNQTIKVSQDLLIKKGKYQLEISLGIENLFNAYQHDFDRGKSRDSNYVYGPAQPRTIFSGIKFVSR